MSAGRNDPCPCGSGKKYKKCCLEKDRAATPAAVLPPLPLLAPSPETGGAERRDALAAERKAQENARRAHEAEQRAYEAERQAFKAAGFDVQIAAFERELQRGDAPVDGESLYEMFEALQQTPKTPEQREALHRAIEQFEAKAPDVFAPDAGYYLSWQLGNALTSGDAERVKALSVKMGLVGEQFWMMFLLVCERLRWHERLDALLAARRAAWPAARQSTDIFGWALDDFAEQAIGDIAIDWLQRHPSAREIDDALRADVAFFRPVKDASLSLFVAHVGGWTATPWELAQFDFLSKPPVKPSPSETVADTFEDELEDWEEEDDWDEDEELDEDADEDEAGNEAEEGDEAGDDAEDDADADAEDGEAPAGEVDEAASAPDAGVEPMLVTLGTYVEENPDSETARLMYLCLDFVPYATGVAGITPLRAMMFARSIERYLRRRHAGLLEPRPSVMEELTRPRSRPEPKPVFRPPAHVLCPDRTTFDAYLADLLAITNSRVFFAAATLALLPVWLRFLESRGLLDAKTAGATLRAHRRLPDDFLRATRSWGEPTLNDVLEQWQVAGTPSPQGRP